ncbi:MAG: hypothetical protein KDB03_25205 [Planctomycetales bacterium]|nr:hypothetical protein [Planctomycetales bacterium]
MAATRTTSDSHDRQSRSKQLVNLNSRSQPASSRLGHTLLELVAASTIISLALIPALKMTRSSLELTESIEHKELAVVLCVSKLEEELALTSANWVAVGSTGTFTSLGHPEMCFSVAKSDSETVGGITGSLMVIQVTVWFDQDRGQDMDSSEPSVQYSTKLAKVLSSEYEATVH